MHIYDNNVMLSKHVYLTTYLGNIPHNYQSIYIINIINFHGIINTMFNGAGGRLVHANYVL